MTNTITLEKVAKSINGRNILDGVNLTVRKNEIVSIIGPSGAGKSTLLRIIAGLDEPSGGRMQVYGKVGMVFQHCHLWPHKTVMKNVTEALIRAKKMSAKEAESKAHVILKKLGLMHKAKTYPDTLSGGEIQRVAIARTLAAEPEIVLLDEITSALDPVLVNEILDILRMLTKEKMTLVIVTHEMGFAREISDRIIFLDKGRIAEQGHPWKMFSNPENEDTRRFINSILTR
jgi:ABC-type polar amino acid transport system ATPase subunit